MENSNKRERKKTNSQIKLRHGKITELAKICGVSRQTVTRALNYEGDTDNGILIRRRAYEYGFVKQF